MAEEKTPEQEILDDIHESFYMEYRDQAVEKLTGAKKYLYRITTALENTELLGTMATAMVLIGTAIAVTTAPGLLTVALAACIYPTFVGMIHTAAYLHREVNKALDRDIENGTLLGRYAQEILPQEPPVDELAQVKQIVAGLQKKFSAAVAEPAVTAVPAVAAALVPAPENKP